MFKLWCLLVALMALSSNAEESNELTCRFAMQYSGVFTVYSCILEEINVKNTSEPIVIKGVHLPGKSNIDVKLLVIVYSNTSSIITQLFEQFPNVLGYIATAAVLNLQGNNATAVDPALIDNITNLQILSMPNNICVNRIFFIEQEKLSLGYLRQELKQCFENFRQDKPKTLTKLILEVEGHLTLYNENGTAILRV
ncbi:unnamed protein product [Diamesa hyperborea]